MANYDIFRQPNKFSKLSLIKSYLKAGQNFTKNLALISALILVNNTLDTSSYIYTRQEDSQSRIEHTGNVHKQYMPLISNQTLDFGVNVMTGFNPGLITYLNSSRSRVNHITYNPGTDIKVVPEGYPNLPIACMQPTGEVDWTCAEEVEDTIRNIREGLGGVEIDLVITGAPEWARDRYFVNEEYWDEYAQFIVEVISRFSQYPYKIKNYTIWNEVELPYCIQGLLGCTTDPETYARFYKVVKDTVEKNGLSVNLMPSEFSAAGLEYMGQFLLHSSELEIEIDKIRVHYYELLNNYKISGLTHHYAVEGGIIGQIQRITNHLEESGYWDTEILITEFNILTTEFYSEDSDAPTCNDPELSEEKAKYVEQFLQEIYHLNGQGYKIELVDMYQLTYLKNDTWSCAGMVDPLNKKLAPHAAVFALTYPINE